MFFPFSQKVYVVYLIFTIDQLPFYFFDNIFCFYTIYLFNCKVISKKNKIIALTGWGKPEIKEFLPELKEVLDKFSELSKADIPSNVNASFQPIEVKNIFREDKIEKCLTQEEALKNAKHKNDGYFKGPRAI